MKGFNGLMEMAKQEAINQFGENFNTDETSTWYKLMAPLIIACTYLEGLAISLKSARNIYTAVESDFENYIYQSGLDENVLENIVSLEKIENDTKTIINNLYDGTSETIDVTEIENNLNNNIQNSLDYT